MRQYWLIGAAVVVVVGIALLIFGIRAVTATVPGDSLYDTKVETYESVVLATKLTHTSKATYELARVRERLAELKELQVADELSAAHLATLTEYTRAYAQSFTERIEGDSIAHQKEITLASEMTAVLRAHELVAELDPAHAESADVLQTLRIEMADLRDEAVMDFVESTEDTEEIQSFIATQLDGLSRELNSGRLSPELVNRVREEIEEMVTDLEEGDFQGAIEALANARERIELTDYLLDVRV